MLIVDSVDNIALKARVEAVHASYKTRIEKAVNALSGAMQLTVNHCIVTFLADLTVRVEELEKRRRASDLTARSARIEELLKEYRQCKFDGVAIEQREDQFGGRAHISGGLLGLVAELVARIEELEGPKQR